MASRSSRWRPALAAIGLLVLFYAAALVAIGGLGALGGWMLARVGAAEHGQLGLVLGGAVSLSAAAVMAWSVLPRRDRFEAPGPAVSAADQPALFAELRALAAATGQAVPARVYLDDDVDAFVAERGGVLGLGSVRVMGLGLPLLRALTVGELRAVIAHELGHFHGGDTRLGPWIHRTRGSMVRTLLNLERAQRHGAAVHGLVAGAFWLLRLPFTQLARGYVRVTLAVSREQERAADRIAAGVAGAPALIASLEHSHRAAIAHATYLRNELAPLIARGVLPPVGEGFTRFLADRAIDARLGELVDEARRGGGADPYDSHPSLSERIAAARALPGAAIAGDDRPAIALIAEPERHETELLAARVARPLTRIAWAETGPVWIAGWRANVAAGRGELARFTIATMPHTDDALYPLALAANDRRAPDGGPDAIRRWAVGALGSAVAVILVDAGFALSADPGAPFRFARDGVTVEPFVELAALLDGRTAPAAWRERYAALGLADAPLAPATS